MQIKSKDLIRLVQRHAFTGTIIDVSEIKGSGSSYIAVRGYINKVLTSEIGEEKYRLANLSFDNPSHFPDNTWAYYLSDKGPTLRRLNTGDELTLDVFQETCREAEEEMATEADDYNPEGEWFNK